MDHPIPKPIYTTVPVKGLKGDFKILHFTDLHACALGEEEKSAMPDYRRDYIPPRIGLFGGGRPYPSQAALPVLIDYGKELNADLILMTGDILDFPSEANLGLLESCLKSAQVPVLSITGNHDWSFADDYHTENAEKLYLTRVDALSGATHHCVCYEDDRILVCAVDSGLDIIRPETLEAYLTAARRAKAQGKVLVVALHVPLHTDGLLEDTVKVWRRNLNIGEGGMGQDHAASMTFWRTVAVEKELAPDLVIAGHLHFDHEDLLPNGVTQLVTDIACDGHCRVITLKGE